MDLLLVSLALALPWLVGILIVHSLLPEQGPNRRLMVTGYGFAAGILTLTMLMRSIDALGLPVNQSILLSSLFVAAAILGTLQLRLRRSFGTTHIINGYFALPRWQQVFTACLLAAVVMRIALLGLEVSWLPLFPWDAYMHWATKSKVWMDAEALVPFVHYDEWLRLQGAGVYTDNHPDYPTTTPLVQTWMNLVLGRWDDALMNLPWVLLLASGAMMFYAQARHAGASPLTGIFFSYLLVSMPIVNLQVALAGYADIFLGFFYLAAVMAFYHWGRNRSWWNGILACAFALACPLIKNEGLFWLLTFLPGLAALLLPRTKFLLIMAAGTASAFILLAVFPEDQQVAGHTLAQLKLQFHAQALLPLFQSLFLFGNWHLLFWLLSTLLVVNMGLAVKHRNAWPTPLFGLGVVLGTATALFLVLFLFTNYSGGAVRHTADSRITLHLAPAWVFF